MYREEVDLMIGFKSTSFVLCAFLFYYISFCLKKSHFVLSEHHISFCRIYKARKGNPGYDNFLSFLNAATDALIYCQTFCNLAETKGLGTCFLGTTIYQPQPIIDALELPPLVFPVATITLGYPDENPPQPDRLPLEAIIHEETYTDYTPERINQFYDAKENLEENKRFVELNQTETLAQIFTDIRYKKSDNEVLSASLLKALEQQGFLTL